MKRTTLVILFCSLACVLHRTSAQRNWWERLPDGSAAISNSRTTTAATPTTTSAPASTTADCGCLSTFEYNPVCGDNKVTYDNLGKLECARTCGQNVQLLFYGRCQRAS